MVVRFWKCAKVVKKDMVCLSSNEGNHGAVFRLTPNLPGLELHQKEKSSQIAITIAVHQFFNS